MNLEKTTLETHEEAKINRNSSRTAHLRAYIRVSWPVISLNLLGIAWIVWSYVYWPFKFTASGAVLVGMAIISDVWLNHGVFKKSYERPDRGLPVKVFAGSRRGIHINYFVFSEKAGPSEDPSKFIIAAENEQLTGGMGTKTGLFYFKIKNILTNPLLSLLELAKPTELTTEPLNISSPNPHTFSGYSRGRMIGKTGNRIEKSISRISMMAALFGTFIWAYGDLLQAELLCNF